MCIYQDVRKNGPFHIGNQKNRAIHILFVEKRGPIIYLAVLKKGAIRHAHPYYAIYGTPARGSDPSMIIQYAPSVDSGLSKKLALYSGSMHRLT